MQQIVPFVRHLPCSSFPGDITTASRCPKCFGSPVADGSSLYSASLHICGYCNALISQKWNGNEVPAHQFHILHPSTAAHGQVHALPASIQRMHRDTALGRSRSVFLSPFHSCSFTAHVQSSCYLQGRLGVHRWAAWPWGTGGWWLCACSSRMQETLV